MNDYLKTLQRLLVGRCNIYVRESAVNPANGRNEPVEVLKLQDIPCRLSFNTIPSTDEKSGSALVQQTVKLFLAKDVNISPGSKLVVTQEGTTASYVQSGKPAVYHCHQEIQLELFKEWA